MTAAQIVALIATLAELLKGGAAPDRVYTVAELEDAANRAGVALDDLDAAIDAARNNP